MGAAASVLRARRVEGMGLAGGLAGARGMSTFLADALRETATSHGIERVVNGSLDTTVGVVRVFVRLLYVASLLLG